MITRREWLQRIVAALGLSALGPRGVLAGAAGKAGTGFSTRRCERA